MRESFAKEQRFFGDAAHELKTAIAVVRSSVQLLMMKPRTPPEYVRLELLPSQEGWVRLAPEAVETLLSNLLLNAIQHSGPDSLVAVGISRDENKDVCLQVVDHGEGISAEALPHIFERFYREDTSRSRETGGTGLGLAISKSIVDSASGAIRVESRKGRGTTVEVNFPAA